MKRKIFAIALLLALLGAAAWVFLRPPPAPPPVLLHPTTHQIAETEKHLAALGQALSEPAAPEPVEPKQAEPKQAALRIKPGPRTLRLSEEDLNVYLAGSKSAQKLLVSHGVQAAQIVLQEPADLIIHATILYRRRPQNIQINGVLAADAKTGLRFTASQARVGSLPLPAAVVTAGANTLAARFSRQMLRRLSITVQSVSVQKKDLVIVALPLRPASPQSK